MKIKAFTQLLGYSIGILVPADLLHVCDTKQVQLIGFGYRWDKSKAVAKERSCKVAFRHQDAALHFAVSHIVHNVWKTGGF